jgi:cysteine desulfurase
VGDVFLNGPALSPPDWRLPGNLNLGFAGVNGEALLLSMKDVALSAGSACTSAQPEPSHVLRALGLDDESVHSGIRFGLGRFNTPEEVELVIGRVAETVARLRSMGGFVSAGGGA